jgi:hypothetical protein
MAELQYSPLLDPRQDNSGSPFLLEILRNSPRTFARSREERSLPILVELTACLASSRHLIVCFPAILDQSDGRLQIDPTKLCDLEIRTATIAKNAQAKTRIGVFEHTISCSHQGCF